MAYNIVIVRLSVSERALWSACFLIESVLIVIGNLIALTIFTRIRLYANKSTYLMIGLTMADFLVGLSTALSALPLMLYSDGYRNDAYAIVDAHFICTIFSTFSSVVLLTAIAFERAYAILFPFNHRLAKERHYFLAIGSSVILSLTILSTVLLLDIMVPNVNSGEHPKYSNVFMIVVSSILLVFVGLAYCIILVKLRFLSKFDERLTTKRNKKLAKTLFIVTVFSFVAWVPEGVLLGYDTFLCDTCRSSVPKHVYMVADVLLYGNSLVNLFVYAFRMPYFRKELTKLLRRCFKCFPRPTKRSFQKPCTVPTKATPIMLLSIQTKR